MSATPSSSHDPALTHVHEGWRRLRNHSPLAAWAAWQEALRLDPDQAAALEALEHLNSARELPPAARRAYRLRSPRPDARVAWDSRLRDAGLDDLQNARAVFSQLVTDLPADAAARFNLGLCLAWSQRNAEAVAALAESALLDAVAGRPEPAAEATTLAEVLRHGAGAEHLADDVRCSLILDWTAALGDPVLRLAPLGPSRVLAVPNDPGDDIACPARRVEWLDRPMLDPADGLQPENLPRVRATMIEGPGVVVFHALLPDELKALEQEVHYLLREHFRPRDRRTAPLPIDLLDSAAWQFRIPEGLDADARRGLARRALEVSYLRDWINRPRLGLGPGQTPGTLSALTPREAARLFLTRDDPAARSRLEGVIRLREELANRPAFTAAFGPIEFDTLRHVLGIETPHPLKPDEPTPVDRLGPEALAALDPATLSESELVAACRAAITPETGLRLARSVEQRMPGRLAEAALRPVAESLLLATLHSDGPEAAWDRLDRWMDAAPDKAARNFFRLLDAQVYLTGASDRDEAATRLSALAHEPLDDPDLLAEIAAALQELGDHEDASFALGRALEAAERTGDLPRAARYWSALDRPPRDPAS